MSLQEPIIVLGCGESINELSPEERKYINQRAVSIALNKFMAFSEVACIYPTHVYFVDNFSTASDQFLQYTFDKCRRKRLRGITFILNKRCERLCVSGRMRRHTVLAKRAFDRVFGRNRKKQNSTRRDVFFLPPACRFQFVSHNSFMDDGIWASSLDEVLFHYRGSLTTVLNYVSIIEPGKPVYLVGTDFNSDKYFFETELGRLRIDSTDWTTPIIKEKRKHFSAIEYKGTTMFDRFEFVVNKLKETDNKLYCTNPDSLLVKKGFVPFRRLPVSV